ncbi:MAG: hypothetical protein M1815_004123 [Lichina confinis]|nr:MAG: hypothetical protein M1815_004123 [Lichina confinis]
MAFDDPTDEVPSYEESMGHSRAPVSPQAHLSKQGGITPSTEFPMPSLQSQLATARQQKIQHLIDRYIHPLVTEQCRSGLYKTTFVLIDDGDKEYDGGCEIVAEGYGAELNQRVDLDGLPPEDYLKIIRMSGLENGMNFWRQDVVLDELRFRLQCQLRGVSEEHQDHRDKACRRSSRGSSSPAAPNKASPSASPAPKAKSSVLGSLFRRAKQQPPPLPPPLSDLPDQPRTCVRQDTATAQPAADDQVKIEVSMSSLYMRTLSAFGMWDSKPHRALSIAIEIVD